MHMSRFLRPRTLAMIQELASSRSDCSGQGSGPKVLRYDNIEKSPQDSRQYRGLLLCNGLKCLLVSDTSTDVSAAALSVGVGSLLDPDDLPGLAHFCEHMLFLGTEKFPDENDYTTYLSKNAGGSNASTAATLTKYHFYVAPEKLNGALDRFSQFFIAPLFTMSATEREVNAVNSEHEKNLTCDNWRIRQVSKSLAKAGHPYGKFSTGNKVTLEDIPRQKNVDVREELLKFHKTWYSANIMCLAVIGREPLEILEQMVVEKFSVIQNKEINIPPWPAEPFDDSQFGQKVVIVPIKDDLSLTLSFVTNDLSKYYQSAPEHYLAHIIGHEGMGSILSELRRQGWCNGLVAGHRNVKNGFGFFDISVDLTQEGLKHVDDIISIIFEYIYMLRKEGPKKWIFDECSMLNEMRFRFKDKEQPINLVNNAVSSMQLYPLAEVLVAPYRCQLWRPELISDLLDDIVPSKCRILLVSQSYCTAADQIEPYYKTKYGLQRVAEETLKSWEACKLNENLAIMQPNAFIPKNLNLAQLANNIPQHPQIILDSPYMRVWHSQDHEFLKPKTCMSFNMCNPVANVDPLYSNLNLMMTVLVKDSLNEFLYDAEVANLHHNITTKSTGISISIQGFSDKQDILLEHILNRLFNFDVQEERFEILKEEVTRSLKNSKTDLPYKHSVYYLSLLLSENCWSDAELLDAMKLVTFERVVQFNKEFCQRIHIECFCYGNITEQETLVIVNKIMKRLENTNSTALPILARQLLQKREHKLLPGDNYLFENENEFHSSSCTQLFLQCGPQTDKSNLMVSLVSQIMREPCYDYLRTKEQLGYIVFSSVRKVNGANGLRIIVQSEKHPAIIEDHIEAFLKKFLVDLQKMDIKDFELHKDSLAVRMLERPKTIGQQFTNYYAEIATAQYHFCRQETEVAILRDVTKEDVVAFFETFIAHGGSERKSLSVYIYSSNVKKGMENSNVNANEIIEKHTRIDDIIAFKSSKELYPLVSPKLVIPAKGARSKL